MKYPNTWLDDWISQLLRDCYSLEEWNLWDNFIYEPEFKSMVWC